jgi:hypothetical protein
MTANALQNEQEQVVDLSFNSPRKINWVVKENPQLQAELNGLAVEGKELSSKVVNKVVDRIKDL